MARKTVSGDKLAELKNIADHLTAVDEGIARIQALTSIFALIPDNEDIGDELTRRFVEVIRNEAAEIREACRAADASQDRTHLLVFHEQKNLAAVSRVGGAT